MKLLLKTLIFVWLINFSFFALSKPIEIPIENTPATQHNNGQNEIDSGLWQTGYILNAIYGFAFIAYSAVIFYGLGLLL